MSYTDVIFNVYNSFPEFQNNRNFPTGNDEYVNQNILTLKTAILVDEDIPDQEFFIRKLKDWCSDLNRGFFLFPSISNVGQENILFEIKKLPVNSLILFSLLEPADDFLLTNFLQLVNRFPEHTIFLLGKTPYIPKQVFNISNPDIKWVRVIPVLHASHPDFKNIIEQSFNTGEIIQQIVGKNSILKIRESKEFYFEKLREKWAEFEELDLTKNQDIHLRLRKEFSMNEMNNPELQSEWKLTFVDLLNDFNSKNVSPKEYYSEIKKGGLKYYVFKLLGEIISYIDEKGYNKSEWNQYSDQRTIAASGVTQTAWIKNLLQYKISKNNLENISSDNIYNAIVFIRNPDVNLNILSENHRKQFSSKILKKEFNSFTFSKDAFSFFTQFKISVNNPDNLGVVYTAIIYSSELRTLWETEKKSGYTGSKTTGGGGGNDGGNKNISNDFPEDDSNPFIRLHDSFSVTNEIKSAIEVEELSIVMANMIKNLKEKEFGKMIGIFGNWGRGKTYLMNKIWHIFEKETTYIYYKVDFHAWKYQDTPASWAYLYEAFSAKYFEFKEEDVINKEIDRLDKIAKLNIERVGWRPLILLFLLISSSALYVYWVKDLKEIKWFLGFLGIISATGFQAFNVAKKSFSEKAKDVFNKYFTKTSFSNLLGVQSEIQKELISLLKVWIKEDDNKRISKKILLFVDDIDRCSEERIMIIIDALRVMLENEEISRRVTVVAAIDERVLKRAIKYKYHDLLEKDCEIDEDKKLSITRNITREYMDKLFLAGINLGLLTVKDRRDVLGNYIGGRVYKEFKKHDEKESDGNKRIAEETKASVTSESDNNATQKKNTLEENKKLNDSEEVKTTKKAIDDPNFDLTEQEEINLLDLMAYYEDATPRQIRIFYYRYLLARNLLLKQIDSGVAKSKITPTLFENLGYIMMHYTISHDLEGMRVQRNSLIEKEGEGTTMTILKSAQVYNTNELIDIYKVLEVVMAY